MKVYVGLGVNKKTPENEKDLKKMKNELTKITKELETVKAEKEAVTKELETVKAELEKTSNK